MYRFASNRNVTFSVIVIDVDVLLLAIDDNRVTIYNLIVEFVDSNNVHADRRGSLRCYIATNHIAAFSQIKQSLHALSFICKGMFSNDIVFRVVTCAATNHNVIIFNELTERFRKYVTSIVRTHRVTKRHIDNQTFIVLLAIFCKVFHVRKVGRRVRDRSHGKVGSCCDSLDLEVIAIVCPCCYTTNMSSMATSIIICSKRLDGSSVSDRSVVVFLDDFESTVAICVKEHRVVRVES